MEYKCFTTLCWFLHLTLKTLTFQIGNLSPPRQSDLLRVYTYLLPRLGMDSLTPMR